MNLVIITSLNPAKISAVEQAFSECFPDQAFEFLGVKVNSDVPEQPMNDLETRQGACNRIANARREYPDADYYVGLEAGIEGKFTYAWMIIENKMKQRGESRSASLILPPTVLAQLNGNNELGDVMDEVFNTSNIKQKGGAIGLLTQQRLTRGSVYQQALILALIPFLNPELY
jgi:inosine/xanthosine triphosphatase